MKKKLNVTYANGGNWTIVRQIKTMVIGKEEIVDRLLTPMTVVNSAAEVMPALNTNVTCDGKEMREHAVIRVVNENYFILYAHTPPRMPLTEIEQNI